MGRSCAYPDGSTPKICIIGAGFAGLTAAIQLKRMLNLHSFTIYDENDDVGGTWLRNKYPGVGSDSSSYLYSWSFELNPEWPMNFASGPDILLYIKGVAKKYALYPLIKLNTQVKSAIYDSPSNKWMITTVCKENGIEERIYYDILISATGLLRAPYYPKEFMGFQGTLVHSAEWDPSVDLNGKVVGVVGSGASAVQIIPTIAPFVKELHCFQRKPAHVLPRAQHVHSNLWRKLCSLFPFILWLIRIFLFLKMEFSYFSFRSESWLNKLATKKCSSYLKEQIPASKMRMSLTPTFPYGCKRVLFHEKYYPALQLPQVKLHVGQIGAASENMIRCADGTETVLDILILATGFKTRDYLDPLKVIGRDSIDLNATWKEGKPSLYLGICTHATPNHFSILGPFSELGHTSVLFMAECQANYIVKLIGEMMKRNVRVIVPKKDIEIAFVRELENKMEEMVWANGNCDAWYADGKGNITAIWPWSSITFWWRTHKIDFSNFDPLL